MAVSFLNCHSFQNTAKKYETSTGKCHRFIPSVPQEFDCRVKANIKQESLYKDLVIKNEECKTLYSEDYSRKVTSSDQWYRAPPYHCINYLRNVEEKLHTNNPAPLAFPLSEEKDAFRRNYGKPEIDEINAPSVFSKCKVVKLGSEQQPAVPVHRKGFWKWTDPYLTVYKSEYIPHDQVDDKISEKIVTFYNEKEFDLPSPSGNKTMFDRCTFKNVLPGRLMSRAQTRVSNYGMHSEYQDHYIKQSFSYMCPYLQDRCTLFEDSLSSASRWQNLAPPGMYCSEYCNIGGLSVRRVIDQDTETKEIVRTKDCCRIKY